MQIQITEEQGKLFEQLSARYEAANKSLQVALQHHTNATASIDEDAAKLWDSLTTSFDLDTSRDWKFSKQPDGYYVLSENKKG